MSATFASLPAAKRGPARAGVFFGVALLFALAVSLSSGNRSYEERLIQVSLKQLVAPEVYRLAGDSTELQAVFLDYADDDELTFKATLAIQKYGLPARAILTAYGAETAFQDVLRRYGENAVPVIDYFVQNDLASVRIPDLLQEKLGTALDRVRKVWSGGVSGRQEAPAGVAPPVEVDGPDRRGRRAISRIMRDGHLFLGQFAIDRQGQAHWLQTTRVLEGAASLFFSGIQNVEKKVTLDEQLKMADLIWAGVDVVGVVSVAKAFKLLRGGAVATRSAQELSLVQRTRLLAPRLLTRSVAGRQFLRWGATAGVVYLVIRHPGLLNSVLAELAERLGIPPWLGKLLGWTVLGFVLLYPLVWLLFGLLRVAIPLLKVGVRGLQWLQRRLVQPRRISSFRL